MIDSVIAILYALTIAAGVACAYDVARRALATKKPSSPDELQALNARLTELDGAFKAALIDWRARFNELDASVQALPQEVNSKVAGTIAAVGALPSAPKGWR